MAEFITSTDIDGITYRVPANEVHPRKSAYAIVCRDDELLLTVQFKKHVLPGGGLDEGETAEEGVVRETKEETGIEVANPQSVATAEKYVTWQESGRLRHVNLMAEFFVCDFVSGEPSMDWLDGYEKEACDMPLWVPVGQLETIERGGALDWLPIVHKTIAR